MMLEHASNLESFGRVALGLAWLLLPLVLGMAAAARRLAHGRAERVAAQLVLGWSQLLLGFELLGSAGLLGFWSLGLLHWLLLPFWLWLGRSRPGPPGPSLRSSASERGGDEPRDARQAWAPILLAAVLTLGPWLRQLPVPPVMEDSLTYHMSLPAEWLSSGELRMPVQHDADQGPTYYPFAGEVLLGWWMLVTGTDQFATGSALLALAAALAALLALAEALGCGARAAAAAWALFAASPLVVWLTLVAFNDLPLAAAMLLALAACARLGREPDAGRAAVAGAALGLVVATKYSGLALGSGIALLAAAALARGARPLRLAGVLVGTAVLVGGFPYARNLLLTGSPVYPAHLELFGVRLFEGLYSAADWVGHPHHRFDWRRHLLTAEGLSRNGWPLALGLLPLGAAGVAVWAARRSLIGTLASAAGWLGLAGFWLSSPYRHDARFYVPAIALLSAGALPLLEGAARRLGRLFEPLLVLVLWASFWVSGFGLSRPVEMYAALALALACLLWAGTGRRWHGGDGTERAGWRRAWLPWALPAAAASALALAQPAYLEQRHQRWLGIYEGHRGRIWDELWRLSPPEGRTVASAGTSNTYPLYGSDLRNRVLFVPRNANTGSHVYGFGHPFASVFEEPDEEAWLENLTLLGVELFVLGPARCEERAWIGAYPDRFELVRRVGGYALYAVRPAGGP
jgi:hypothetical protein